MKLRCPRLILCMLSALLLCGAVAMSVWPVAAADTAVYLGDREDLFLGRESLDGFGWNTAHSGEPITIGSASFDKGIGFHCLPDKDAYAEFDISSLGMKYLAASVGVLKEAGYFIEWGSISFHVYGDGKLLASSPLRNWGDEPYFLTCSVEGVKTLRLVQKNENGHACDAGVWGDLRLTMTAPAEESDPEKGEDTMNPDKTELPQPSELISGDTAFASDLYWIHNQGYSGGSAIRDGNCSGEYIWSCDLKRFPKGIGIHAASASYNAYVDINIEGIGYTKFATWYGVCETLSGNDISMATVKFAVYGDDKQLFESDTMRYNQAFDYIEVDVTGVKTLRLAIAGAPSISGAWGVFGGAVLSKSGDLGGISFYEEIDLEGTIPETEAPTEPVTEPVTDASTEPATQAPAESEMETLPAVEATDEAPGETTPDESGCAGTLAGSALGIAALGTVVALKKKKED